MRKAVICFFLLVFVAVSGMAQAKLTWRDFADIDFESVYNEKYEVYFLKPKFGQKIKTYQGKKISITGFFLDLSGSGEIFLVSQNPMASCFFCGGAGPETIIEVAFKEKPAFRTDQVVSITGILELNADDVDHCNYILNLASGRLVN
ncbi:MAG: hypothetical protein AAGL29_10400 [Bacteroidota bacterium]